MYFFKREGRLRKLNHGQAKNNTKEKFMRKNKYLLNYFSIALIAVLLSNCSLMKSNKTERVELKVLNYGKSSAKLLYTEKNNNLPSGEKRTTDYKLNITEVTDTIKLYKGVQFGIEYILESSTTKLITLTTIWTYPSIMKNNEGKTYEKAEYNIDKYTNQYTYSNYTIEEPYEMLPGKWNLKIRYGNKEILDKNFYLVE